MLPRAKKRFGQNFLIDTKVVKDVVAAAELTKGDKVFEIGPGTGVLTQALVDSGAHVTAMEIDPDLIVDLRAFFGDSLELIEGDVMNELVSQPILEKIAPYSLVSSLPYNITSDVLRRFLTRDPKPKKIVLIVQKEVADRVSGVNDMSLLSVVCQLYAVCTKVRNVKPGSFRPIPGVDSAILKLELYEKEHPLLQGMDPERVIRLAKSGFSSRRKQLQKNMSTLPGVTSAHVQEFLVKLGKTPTARAEELTVDEWINIARNFSK